MWTGSLEQYLARKELAKLSFPEGRILLLPDIKAIVPTLLLVSKLSASYLVFTHYFQLLWFSKCNPPILILGKLTLCLKHMKFFKHQTATQNNLTFVDLKQSIEKLWNSDNVKGEQNFFMSSDLSYCQKNASRSHNCGNSVHSHMLFTQIAPQKALYVWTLSTTLTITYHHSLTTSIMSRHQSE